MEKRQTFKSSTLRCERRENTERAIAEIQRGQLHERLGSATRLENEWRRIGSPTVEESEGL
jgi:hypothetical protein